MKNIFKQSKKTYNKTNLLRSIVFLFVGIIILIALLFICKSRNTFKEADKTDSEGTLIVAWINNKPLYKYQLDYFIEKERNRFLPILMKDRQSTVDIDWNEKINGVTVKDTIRSNAIEQLINYSVALMKAKDQGIQLEPFEIEYISKCVDDDINIGDDTYQHKLLARNGVYLADQYLEMKKGEALVEKYKKSILASLIVTDEEVYDYYKKHLSEYKEKDYDELQVIFISDREKGTRIYNEIIEHKINFETAYDQYCETNYKTPNKGVLDPSSGKMYYQLMTLIEERNVQENEITNILMNFSSYIVLRKGIVKGTSVPFEQIQNTIREVLLNEKYLDTVEQFGKSFDIVFN